MRSGLHNIAEGFSNGLAILFQTIAVGFVRAAPAQANSYLLLESGDFLLLESGDKLILE